jgi:hypothetical protein
MNETPSCAPKFRTATIAGGPRSDPRSDEKRLERRGIIAKFGQHHLDTHGDLDAVSADATGAEHHRHPAVAETLVQHVTPQAVPSVHSNGESVSRRIRPDKSDVDGRFRARTGDDARVEGSTPVLSHLHSVLRAQHRC